VTLVAHLFLVIGGAFMFLGALGLLRMPDVYNRIQAGTKAVTLGAMSVLIGVGFEHPDWWGRLLLIGGFILFTNPVGSSTIARALYLSGVRPWQVEESRDPADEADKLPDNTTGGGA
jgi:multicomponent Na+:H+ antiporter subunit G